MYLQPTAWLPLIFLIPLLGALLNGLFGGRLGKGFVRTVGVGAPALSFTLALAVFVGAVFQDDSIVVTGQAQSVHRAAERLSSSLGSDAVFEQEGRDGVFLRVPGATSPDQFELKQAEVVVGGVEVGYAKDLVPTAFAADLGAWIAVEGFEARFAFLLDRLAMILALVITGVGTLIHLYSTGYMEEEDAGGFARYFSYLNLFVGAMLVLVMASDLMVMFIGWEGVGLCSYLLIGFDYHKSDSAACGSKAFIVNRIGDLGFVLGMLGLLVIARDAMQGDTFGLDMAGLNGLVREFDFDQSLLLGVSCLLLFVGATGKSAQIPLHVWLPDAMAGPTPVSALIHAATMVTAGVYMIARLSDVFSAAHLGAVPVLGIVAAVGVLTAFFAATAALAQDDIKRVLAYSTVSQLGYMFVGVGAAAFGAAVFHLVTHAFFKALLFLGSGAVIHACHSQNMKEMGGLRKLMPTTFITMLAGGLALAGLIPFAGFFSKDMILFEVMARSNHPHSLQWAWLAIYILGVLTAALTAVYTLRMICLTFLGDYRGRGQPHEAPQAMTAPLVILAVLALISGALFGLPEVWAHDGLFGINLPTWLDPVVAQGPIDAEMARFRDPAALATYTERLHSMEVRGLWIGVAVGFLGAGVGLYLWSRPPALNAWEYPVGVLRGVKALLGKAWYYDELLNKRFFQPATKYLATIFWRYVDDGTIDRGLVDGTGRVGVELSNLTRALQTGRVARYAGYFVLGAVVLPLLVVLANPVYQLLAGSAGGH